MSPLFFHYMAFLLCDLFTLVHSCAHFINPGKRDFGNGQFLPAFLVDKIHISKLEAREDFTANRFDIFLKIEFTACNVVV